MTTSCRRFVDKSVVVTAGTAGLGLAIARRLAQEGAKVLICSRKKDNVDAAVERLRGEGLAVYGAVCHVGLTGQRQSLVATASSLFGGRLDVLVSNAAVNPEGAALLDTSESAMDKMLDINVKAPVLLCQAFKDLMVPGAAILLVTSVTGFDPTLPIPFYATTKTALLGLVKGLAAEFAAHNGTRVNALAPGIVATKFAQTLIGSAESRAAIEATTMLGRLGLPEDMGAAAAYLLSSDAAYVTAETLVVAGGMRSRL